MIISQNSGSIDYYSELFCTVLVRCRHVAVYAFGSFVTWNVLDPVRLPEFKVLIDVS